MIKFGFQMNSTVFENIKNAKAPDGTVLPEGAFFIY